MAIDASARFPLPPTPPSPDEPFWTSVRRQFLMPSDLIVMNAANLSPASIPVIDALNRSLMAIERDPSAFNRAKMGGRETCRELIAQFLNVRPGEIVIARNASDANNLVSNGIDLKPGDEVLVYSDNHSSNNAAWHDKARRFGFTVAVVDHVNPHPGAAHYIQAFVDRMTPRTRLLAITHVTGPTGDVLPVRELSRAARERGVLTLVDGAQSFGMIPIDLGEMRPDFFTASAHKWACGPKEVGILYVGEDAQSRIWPTVVSSNPGPVGISRTLEAFGHRNEAAIAAFGEALTLQTRIGRQAIETRIRALAQRLIEGLTEIDGVHLWTHRSPERSAAIVSFKPGALDPGTLSSALYETDKIVCAARTGSDRPGLRFSPHFYNSPDEVERVIAAIRQYIVTGV